MKKDISASIHNRFDIEVIDSRTGEVRQKAKAENVICNTYWTALVGQKTQSIFSRIVYGSGSGTPSVNDTVLFHFDGYKSIGDATVSDFSYDSEKNAEYRVISVVLGVDEAVGVTLSEVGIALSNNNVLTHAMLEDMNGNLISIEKTDTDIINIYATFFIHVAPQFASFFRIDNIGEVSALRTGLAVWLCGHTTQNIFESGIYAYPLNIAYFSRENPNNYFLDSKDNQIQANMTLDAGTKTITITCRVPVDKFNIDGGIKYVSICGGSLSNNNTVTRPQIVLPIGSFLNLEGYNISADSVGTGDGSKTAFQTHFDVARDFVLKVNGTAVSNYTRDGRNITFAAAPEIGAVVTADYFTDTIPKDENHVYDLTVTISFGEYVPE